MRQHPTRAIAAVTWLAMAAAAPAADIVLTPPAAGGVTITNAAGNATRFRVGDDGAVAFPALGIVPGTFTGLCLEVATGKVGTCAAGPANPFVQGGNAFAATASLGTNDNQALELKANNARVSRFEPNATSPNIIAGFPLNAVSAGGFGGSIGGGGEAGVLLSGSRYLLLNGQYFACPLAGCSNRVTDAYGTIAGGVNNQAGDNAGTATDRLAATVGGGFNNLASGLHSTVAGGGNNTAGGTTTGNSTVGGGYGNTAGGDGSTVCGGESNVALGAYAGTAGGRGNRATGDYSIAAGGSYNIASGIGSFAAGTGARTETGGVSPTPHNGAFVWADNSISSLYTFNSVVANEFAARATGGVRFATAVTTLPGLNYAVTAGVSVAAGSGTWASLSDVAAKRDLVVADSGDVLDRLVSMPVYRWRYLAEKSNAVHLGPTAQDFHAAFGLGDSDKTITTIDEGGVALAAIQGLHRLVREQEVKLDAQAAHIAKLERDREWQVARIDALEGEVAKVAELRRETARMARLLERLEGDRNLRTAHR